MGKCAQAAILSFPPCRWFARSDCSPSGSFLATAAAQQLLQPWQPMPGNAGWKTARAWCCPASGLCTSCPQQAAVPYEKSCCHGAWWSISAGQINLQSTSSCSVRAPGGSLGNHQALPVNAKSCRLRLLMLRAGSS